MAQAFLQRLCGHADVEAAVRNCETAFRMQAEVPGFRDIGGETRATRQI